MTYQTTPGPHRNLQRWMTDQVSLPDDVLDAEVTNIVLFALSVLLNRATGGLPDMTFSARTALARRHGGWRGPLWLLACCAIDLYCRIFRAEHAHCDTALNNYHLRRGCRE